MRTTEELKNPLMPQRSSQSWQIAQINAAKQVPSPVQNKEIPELCDSRIIP